MDEKRSILDNNLLTEHQKKEISSIIDLIVEERLKQKYNEFIQRYTKLIVESSAKHIVKKCKDVMEEEVDSKISQLSDKHKKVVKSMIVEATDKIRQTKSKCKEIVEEIKTKTPMLIESKVNRKVELLAEEHMRGIEKCNKIQTLFQDITKGLEASGYTINEDIDHKVENANKELRIMREHMEELEKKNRIYELTEGFTPTQTKKMREMLESCQTAEDVEKKFKSVKNRVLESAPRHVESKPQVFQESKDPLEELLNQSSKFINRGMNNG